MDEGSKRRSMAAKILAAAVQRMIGTYKKDSDWVIGGDYNAELAADDFRALLDSSFVPLSAGDEAGGAFSYVASPKSLIDHIFLSPNLAATYDEGSFFIVAKDRDFPQYVKRVSDHRPVVVRLSLQQKRESAIGRRPELPPELVKALGQAA